MASKEQTIRLVFWNIMHGGGSRADKIVEQITQWNPDIVAFAEFRGTTPSESIAKRLLDAEYRHQLTTVNVTFPSRNALFLASRHQLTRVYLDSAPRPFHRWLFAKVLTDTAFHIGVVGVPSKTATSKRDWLEYCRALLRIANDWQAGPGLIVGDTNSGLNDLDEETKYSRNYKDTLMNPIKDSGWLDIFRVYHPFADAPTWYSPYGNGFRLDQAFVNSELQSHVTSCVNDWGCVGDQGKVSDHAALLLDLKLAG